MSDVNYNELPFDLSLYEYVQQQLNQAKVGDWIEFSVEENSEMVQYRVRKTLSVEIDRKVWERAEKNGTTAELLECLKVEAA
jgi:hypothetical protein